MNIQMGVVSSYEWCKAVFAKPQQAMRQQLRIGHPIVLNNDVLLVSDMFMIQEYDHSVAYTVLYTDEPDGSNCMFPKL